MAEVESSCSCEVCQGACTVKPGWFKPGEAEKAAELMGLDLQTFFDTYLGVDWYIGDEGRDIFVLSPTVTSGSPGEMFDANPRGRCVFFDGQHCKIYAARPYECRMFHHDQGRDETHARHEQVAKAWEGDGDQEQIEALLGEEPESAPYSFFDALWD